MATNDKVTEILEDTKERLRLALPGMEFFFMLMPVDPAQINALGADALVTVEKRMVQHLQKEMNDAFHSQNPH